MIKKTLIGSLCNIAVITLILFIGLLTTCSDVNAQQVHPKQVVNKNIVLPPAHLSMNKGVQVKELKVKDSRTDKSRFIVTMPQTVSSRSVESAAFRVEQPDSTRTTRDLPHESTVRVRTSADRR